MFFTIFTRSRLCLCSSVCALLLFLGGKAFALMPADSLSVEVYASRADCVVTGIIERQETITGPATARYTPSWTRLTVRTTERLLGDTGDEFVCTFPTPYTVSPGFSVGEEALFLLVRGSRLATTREGKSDPWFASLSWTMVPDHADLPYYGSAEPLVLNRTEVTKIVTMRLEAFTNRQEVLDEVRRYCRRPLPAFELESLWNPDPDRYSTASKLPWTPVIDIPLDANADALARTWITASNDILRGNAVRVLRHTHSALNAESLANLVRQPAGTGEQDVARSMALSTLASWGKPTDWTRNHESVGPNGPATVNFWICAALVPIASVTYWSSFARGKGWRRATISAWLLALSFLLVITARSFLAMDGYEWGHWKAGAMRGDAYLIWMFRKDVPNVPPFLWENPRNIPEISDPSFYAYNTEWDWTWSQPLKPFTKYFGIESYGQDIYPTWFGGITYRLPLWLAILVWCTPIPFYYALRLLHRIRSRPQRGFPVVMHD